MGREWEDSGKWNEEPAGICGTGFNGGIENGL